MLVLKFGGTSMGSRESMLKVLEIIRNKAEQQPVIVVVSAMSGITDILMSCGLLAAGQNESYRATVLQAEKNHLDIIYSLITGPQRPGIEAIIKNFFTEIKELCNGIFLLGEITPRVNDRLVSYGELLSSNLMTALLQANKIDCQLADPRLFIKTNSNYGNAVVDFKITNDLIADYFGTADTNVTIVPGFIASNLSGLPVTLGRGGSDYTAAIIAAATNAVSLEIWTDVSGMMTADPRWVTNAKVIPSISYQEAMELSHFGAKVIYPPTIQPVMNKNIPVWIKNTFAPADHGTVIQNVQAENDDSIVRGISSIKELALLSLEGSGMVGIPGFSKRLFESLAAEQVNVILITQGSSEHSICVGVEAVCADKAKAAIDTAFEYEIAARKVEPLLIEKELSIIALVGDNMKNHTGISGKMFSALGRNGVNIRAIAQGSSERNISAVIGTRDVRKAVNVLHEDFFETTYKQVNLFITGLGNVGKKLISQLVQQKMFLQNHLRLQINITGLCTSRNMLIREEGIDVNNWERDLLAASKADIDEFINNIVAKNLRNTVFVDVTASDAVAAVYERLLKKSIAVVACNKVAPSSSYENYKKLKELSREFSAPFLFETNVGAGLPVIGTLNDLLRSGDQVHRMQAVLSGTLNFVFNNYDGSRKFADVVKQAQDEGYTEPDPRLDLSGTDVMRKIMILGREAGLQLEMEDITCNAFLPESCMHGTVEDFYKEMMKHESHFLSLYKAAVAENCKLKFVATLDNGNASVGLQYISPQHDLYHLYGKDNVVLFYTDRYAQQPLVIKGAGAGADVTASGVFADIIRAAG